MSKYGSPFELGRFLRSDWLKEHNSRVHWKAFIPPENGSLLPPPRLEVSCFEVQGLLPTEVFAIADNSVPPLLLNTKPPVGYVVIPEQNFPQELLALDFNDSPTRHVNIIGWEHYNKEERKKISTYLAENAVARIEFRPQPPNPTHETPPSP